jgi:hypothetical protein
VGDGSACLCKPANEQISGTWLRRLGRCLLAPGLAAVVLVSSVRGWLRAVKHPHAPTHRPRALAPPSFSARAAGAVACARIAQPQPPGRLPARCLLPLLLCVQQLVSKAAC